MPRYFFHLHDDHDTMRDREDAHHADLASAMASTLRAARSMISHDALEGFIRLGWVIEVEDGAERVVHRLRFKDAVAIGR
jgi:hypothetical protein